MNREDWNCRAQMFALRVLRKMKINTKRIYKALNSDSGGELEKQISDEKNIYI